MIQLTTHTHTHTHTHILFQILFPYRLQLDIEYSSLFYTVGPCWLSILYIIVVYINTRLLIYLPPSLLVTINLFSMPVSLFLFYK